jgi:hypothetical protein
MVTRITILCAALLTLHSCDCTDVDVFGDRTVVEVPIESSPAQTSFLVGDTIWWSGDFSNQVRVEGVDQRLNLEDFNFFSSFSIQHVPQSADLVDSAIDVFTDIGDLTFINADEFLDYSISMVEIDGRFKFKFGIVLRKAGVYLADMSTIFDFDFYDHPALYGCERTRREDFRIHYINSSTDRVAYETIFEPLTSPEILAASTFEKYADVGSITFIVTE